MTETPQTHTYSVTVGRQNDRQAVAEARGHHLALNIRKGDGNAGFNAAETLLAALGACILTNVSAIAEKMHLQIDAMRVEIDATRGDEPPALNRIIYRLVLDSSEPKEKLDRLHELALNWGTVTNTLINGLVPEGVLVLEPRSMPVDARGGIDA